MSASPQQLEKARAILRERGIKVGRKKGSFGVKKMARIKSEENFIKEFEKDLRPLFDTLMEKALSGDVPAIKLILDRLWGTPKGALDINQNISISLVDLAQKAALLTLQEDGTYKEKDAS